MAFEVGQSASMKGGGWDRDVRMLALLESLDIETVAVSEDGVAEVTLEVPEVKELPRTAENPNSRQMNTTGVTGSYKINTEGIITELTLDPPPHSRTVAKPFLDSMRSKLRSMAPPFPKEPVGVGAKWTATQVIEFVTRMKEEVTVELVKRTGSEVALSFEVKSTGVKHHDFTPPQDVAVDVETRGQAKLNLNKVVPRSSELDVLMIQTVETTAEDGSPTKLKMTIDRTIKMQSK